MREQATSDWYASAAASGAVHAAAGAVLFGVLAPLTVLGMDVWDAHVGDSVTGPSWDAGTLVGLLYLALLAGMVALVPAVLLGGVLGAANGAVAQHPAGRTPAGALAVGLVVGLLVGGLVPALVLGGDVLLWLRVLTGVVAGAACAVHLRYLARRAES